MEGFCFGNLGKGAFTCYEAEHESLDLEAIGILLPFDSELIPCKIIASVV